MRDHSHHSHTDDGVCALCGQPLPVAGVSEYGQRKTNRTGIAVTIALHLLVILIFFLQPKRERHAPPPAGANMVYIAPLPLGKPKKTPPQQQAPQKVSKTKPNPKQQVVNIKRLPNTITIPNEPPVEVVKEVPTPVKEVAKEPPAEVDMEAYIKARRAARGARDPSDAPGEESENAKATRVAMANIAAANGRSRGADKEESMFSIVNKTFNSADVKFRSMNPNFKRRWLQQVHVEQGLEPDIETAIVNRMILMIRAESSGDITWKNSRATGRDVNLSARPKDTAELQAFLFKEMFPDYKPPRR